MQDITRSKLKLAALLLIAVVPITMATFAFRAAVESGGLFSTVNKGNLILPPLDVTALDMRELETGAMRFLSFEERVAGLDPDDYSPEPWTLVFVNTRACADDCRERVHYLRQMHVRLNREQHRVRRYYLHVGSAMIAEGDRTFFNDEFPGMGIVVGQRELIQRNLRDGGVDIDLGEDNYIFVVDPVGNVMMYYDSSHSTQDIMSDVQRLLQNSSLG